MFIEVETARNEPVLLNVDNILYVTKDKKHTIIVDNGGCDYVLNDTYDDVLAKLKSIKN